MRGSWNRQQKVNSECKGHAARLEIPADNASHIQAGREETPAALSSRGLGNREYIGAISMQLYVYL